MPQVLHMTPMRCIGQLQTVRMSLMVLGVALVWITVSHVSQYFEIPPATEVTELNDLPKPAAPDSPAWDGITGLNVQQIRENPPIAGQPVLRLTAVPQHGAHRIGLRLGDLQPNQVYRVVTWVKPDTIAHVVIEGRDSVRQPEGKPAHYGLASFDLRAPAAPNASGDVQARGVEPGPSGWLKAWIDLPSDDGSLFIYVILARGNLASAFKGDGRLRIVFGGIQAGPLPQRP